MWIGEKRIIKSAPNIGFVVVGNDYDFFESICRSFLTDWDVEIDEPTLDKYVAMSSRFGRTATARIEAIFEEKWNTSEKTKLIRILARNKRRPSAPLRYWD